MGHARQKSTRTVFSVGTGFQSKGQALSWDFKLYQAGTYEIVLNCRGAGRQSRKVEGKLCAHVAGQSVEGSPNFGNGGRASLGKVRIGSSGTYTCTLEVTEDFRSSPRYQSVMLVPVAQD